MAKKRSSSKGTKRGESGGANPKSSREITEQQHEDAMRVLRAEYFQSVRGLVEELKRAIKDGEITSEDDLNERVHQDVDGSYWVIYTHANFQVLMCSDHHDAYSEQYGQPAVEGDSINWAALAFVAMEQDVRDLMGAEGVEIGAEVEVEETTASGNWWYIDAEIPGEGRKRLGPYGSKKDAESAKQRRPDWRWGKAYKGAWKR